MTAKRRTWFRLSLKTALLLVTIACIWLAWLSHTWKQQEIALSEIRSLGGNLITEPGTISWLVDLLPGSASPRQRVLSVTFLGPKVSDAEVKAVVEHVSVLPHLEDVKFVDTAITSNGEEFLRNELPELDVQVVRTAWQEPSTPR